MSCLSSSFVSSVAPAAFHARSSSVAGCSVVVPQTVRRSRGGLFFLSFFLFPLLLLLRFWMRAIFNPKEEDECFWINALLTRKISFDALGGEERLLETRRMTDAFSRAMLPPPSTTTEHVVERVLLYHRSRTQKRDRVGQKWSRFEPKVQRRETVRPRKMPRGEHHRPSVRKQVPRRAGRRDGERLYLVRVERWGNLV